MIPAAFRLTRTAWLVIALGTAAGMVLAARVGVANYTSDHWAYVDIAANLLTDPGAMNQIRSFYHPAYTNTGWPFGWPLLQLPLIAVLGPNAPVAVILNVLALSAAAVLLMALMRSLRLSQWFGLAALVTILALPPTMPSALSGAVNIIGAVLVLAGLTVAIIWRDTASGPGRQRRAGRPAGGLIVAVVLGLIAAAMANVRFDLIVVAVPLGIIAWWLRTISRRGLLAFIGVLLAVGVLPWALYSRVVLGAWWASDNSGIATAVAPWPGYLQYGLTGPRAGAGDDPIGWIARLVGNIPEVLTSLEGTLGGAAVILAGVALVWVAVTTRRSGWAVAALPLRQEDWARALAATAGYAAGIGLAQFGILIAINNWEDRYWLPTAAVLVVLTWLGIAGVCATIRGGPARLPVVLTVTATVLTLAATSPEVVGALIARSPTTAWAQCRAPGPAAAMYAQHRMAAYFGALGDRTVYQPDNAADLTMEQWQQIVDAYGIRTAVMPTQMWQSLPALHPLVAHQPCPYLFGAA